MREENFDKAMAEMKAKRRFVVTRMGGKVLYKCFSISKPSHWVIEQLRNRFHHEPNFIIYEDSTEVYREVNYAPAIPKFYDNKRIKNTITKQEYDTLEECMEQESLTKATVVLHLRNYAGKFKLI